MEKFLQAVKTCVSVFKQLNQQPIKLVSHLDCDGLTSSSILIKALKRENIPFSLTTVRQLDDFVFEELRRENYPVLFFLDLGSGSLSTIEKIFSDRQVFILDHHALENYNFKIIHVLNPHLYGVDGSRDISGAGVAYLFAKALNSKNMDLAHLAIIGAIGDMQENNGFESELNNFILEDALNLNTIEITIGLRMFGMQTRPINKVLEYTTDPYIPGVSGSASGAEQFISELGIDAQVNGKYKKLVQLNHDDLKKIVTGIILRRLGSEEKPEDVLGKIYILKNEDDESPMKDAKEFSTLLNACGRMNKPSVGIGSCLSDEFLKKEALGLLYDYKRELISALEWFHRNKERFVSGDGFVIINAEHYVKETIIGTLSSLIMKSNIYDFRVVILSSAYTLDGNIKISIRGGGGLIDLRKVIQAIVEQTGGIAGGHKYAAGALISQDKEEKFMKVSPKILSSILVKHKL